MDKNTKIKFVGDTADKLQYQPTEFKNSFYQICQFKNPKTGLYSIRKAIFNEKYEIIAIFEKQYDTKTIKKFMKQNDPNKYKLFPINDLSYLSPPNSSDFMNAHSDLTNKKINTHWDNMLCSDPYNCSGNMAPVDTGYQTRKVGSASKEFYDGAPTKKNLESISCGMMARK